MAYIDTAGRLSVRSVLRYQGVSAFKVRPVLDLIRGKDAEEAAAILRACPRGCAPLVGKVLAAAAANAENNEGMNPEELYVVAAYADEANTAKRWRPRARGRATRIRKRSCHITIVLERMSEEDIHRKAQRHAGGASARRSRRVAASRLLPRRGRERGGESMEAATEAGATEAGATEAGATEDAATPEAATEAGATEEDPGAGREAGPSAETDAETDAETGAETDASEGAETDAETDAGDEGSDA